MATKGRKQGDTRVDLKEKKKESETGQGSGDLSHTAARLNITQDKSHSTVSSAVFHTVSLTHWDLLISQSSFKGY